MIKTSIPCALDLCPYDALPHHALCWGCRWMLPDDLQRSLNSAWRYRVEWDRFPPDYEERLGKALDYLKNEDFYKRLQDAAKLKTG